MNIGSRGWEKGKMSRKFMSRKVTRRTNIYIRRPGKEGAKYLLTL